jgi:hypothetical protein
MKIYQAITILILISYIYASYCDNSAVSSPTKAEDCTSHKANGGYCCFVKARGGNYCNDYGPNEFKYVKDYVKLGKKCHPSATSNDCEEYKDYSIDCKSSYLVLSLLSLILLFI